MSTRGTTGTQSPAVGPLWTVGSGQLLRPGAELGRGGEGSVRALDDRPEQVVKLYHAVPSAQKIAKLTALVAAADPTVQKVAVWPQDLVRDLKGQVVGFLMPRLADRRDIHQLYSPRSRATAFPAADFRFIVHVAANIARAFAVLHAQGHIVVGDVNHGSIVVNPNGTVQLLDCDSFQIRAGAEVFACDVGVPLFTAPELHGQSFRGLVRTPNHDNFGLAVVLFHLLCVGRHPFAGRFMGVGEMPIERAITEFRFAYGADASARQMMPPPGTVPLEMLGNELSGLFRAAFAATAVAADGRPTAADWVGALDRLSAALTTCTRSPAHHFPPVGPSPDACPWCALEAQTGLRLFGQPLPAGVGPGVVDVGQLWAAIEAVPLPPAAPPLPGNRSVPPVVPPVPPAVRWVGTATMSAIVVLLMLVVTVVTTYAGPKMALLTLSIGGGVLIGLLQHNKWRSADEKACAAAKANWESALAMWRTQEAQTAVLAARRLELEQTRVVVLTLATERQKRLQQLEKARFERQLERYLEHFYVESATINRIGPSRKAMLRSFGIETAADVEATRIQRIPGFGDALTDEVLSWRRGLAQRFHPNPHEPLNPQDIAKMDQTLAHERQQLLNTLRDGPAVLARLSQEITAARTRLLPLLDKAWVAWQYAENCRTAR